MTYIVSSGTLNLCSINQSLLIKHNYFEINRVRLLLSLIVLPAVWSQTSVYRYALETAVRVAQLTKFTRANQTEWNECGENNDEVTEALDLLLRGEYQLICSIHKRVPNVAFCPDDASLNGFIGQSCHIPDNFNADRKLDAYRLTVGLFRSTRRALRPVLHRLQAKARRSSMDPL